MAVYGLVRHQKNIIHILPYDPQCHELFAIYYTSVYTFLKLFERNKNAIVSHF
jgi:hypothetical protein